MKGLLKKLNKVLGGKMFLLFLFTFIFVITTVWGNIGDSGYSGIQVENYFSGSGKQGINQNISFNDSEYNNHKLFFEDGLLVNYTTTNGQPPFPSNGLVAYYKLDESSGNATDSYGTSNLIQSGAVPQQTGIINGARGSYSSENNFKNSNVLTLNQDVSYSISFWILRNGNITSDERIISGGLFSFGGYNFLIQFLSNNKITTTIDRYGVGLKLTLISDNEVPLQEWTHIVFTYDSSTREGILYLNGVSESSGIASSDSFSTAANLYLGIREGSYGPLSSGYLDEVGYWNRKLDSGEILDLYNNGNGATYLA